MTSLYTNIDEEGKFLSKSAFWRNLAYVGVGIVIVSIIAAIVLILVLTYKNPVNKKPYSFESMFNTSLSPQSFSAVWSISPTGNSQMLYWKYINSSSNLEQPRNIEQMLLNNEYISTNGQACEIISKNPSTGAENVIFAQANYQNTIPCGTTFAVSFDGRYISFKTEVVKVFRHSILGKYLIFDTQSKQFTNVSSNPNNKQKTLAWCPGGNSLAFVENNNIFIRSTPDTAPVQVTTDGDNELVFNGVTDWLYEEEVFGSVDAFVWNQDCSKLAFLKLNDSQVPVYRYEEYNINNPYPIPVNIRIPAPGAPNPIPTVYIYDITSNNLSNVDLGPVNTGDLTKDFYVYDLKFANNTALAIVKVPRIQQQKQILIAQADTTASVIQPQVVRVETTDTWIQYAREVRFLPGGLQFVDIVAFNDSYHIALFNAGQQEPIAYLTSGQYDVTSILGYSSTTDEVFYVSTETGSTQRQIYAVNVKSKEKRALSDDKKDGYYSATFSSDAQFFILNYGGPELPYTLLKSIDPSKNISEKLADNSNLQSLLNAYNMPQIQIGTIKNAVGDNMNTLYVFPPGWVSGTEVQYPVLMYMYNGPGSQLVSMSYSAMHNPFSMYMASQGFIVVTVDGRGTGFKGINYMTITYKNLGQKEVEDQIYAAQAIAARSDTDGTRMAIWGWSYGGYMASKTVSSILNKGIFKLGISVAPVTDWRYYDSAYTERYMLWPSMNPEGYQNSSVINQVANSSSPLLPSISTDSNGNEVYTQSSTRFVLVQGTADDNVHPLNSYNLMTELQQNQVQFEVMFYPNKDHSITGGNTRKHLYKFLYNKIVQYVYGATDCSSL
jgi:dipeptidyl aminopeptidase/acylaminoacyl peptidase